MGACFTTVCTLTLLPYKNIQWPRPTETLHMSECIALDYDANFAQNAPFLEDNLCISYQGSQCMGAVVTVFPCADFGGVPYVATLNHNSGTVCLPYEVKTTASSIFTILAGAISLDAAATPAVAADATADVTVAATTDSDATDAAAPTTTPPSTTLDLQSLADNGLIAQDAVAVLQQADQGLVRAAIRSVQQMDPTTLAATFATIPLSSDEVSALLASATTVVPIPAAATSDATTAAATTTSDASDAATTGTTAAPATTTSDASDAATTGTTAAPAASS